MIRTSYLRVYQPLTQFDEAERLRWREYTTEDPSPEVALGRRWLIDRSLPGGGGDLGAAEGAFVREIAGEVLVCPWRTRLRMLTSLLAFRGTIPDEVADAFVPEAQARRAADELVALERAEPGVRSHILHANWHVPLRWFAAFSDGERILTEDRAGLRVRYETRLEKARRRLAQTVEILDTSWIDDEVTDSVRELDAWLEPFSPSCLLELDYATVAGIFEDEELVDDRSARDVWSCLEALAAGDVLAAGRTFAELTDRWSGVRAHEVVN